MESWQQIVTEAGRRPEPCSADAQDPVWHDGLTTSPWTLQPDNVPFPQHDQEQSGSENHQYANTVREPAVHEQLAAPPSSKASKKRSWSFHAQDVRGPSRQPSKGPMPYSQQASSHHKRKPSIYLHRPPLRTLQPGVLSSPVTPKPQKKRLRAGTRRIAPRLSQASPADGAHASPLHPTDSKAAEKSKRVYAVHSLQEVLSPASLQQHAMLTSTIPGESFLHCTARLGNVAQSGTHRMQGNMPHADKDATLQCCQQLALHKNFDLL